MLGVFPDIILYDFLVFRYFQAGADSTLQLFRVLYKGGFKKAIPFKFSVLNLYGGAFSTASSGINDKEVVMRIDEFRKYFLQTLIVVPGSIYLFEGRLQTETGQNGMHHLFRLELG